MTTNGLIMGIFTGVFVGGFLGLLWSSNCNKLWSKALTIMGFMIVCFCIAGFGFSGQETSFNNGICPQCNTKYEAIQHKNGDTYYECPNCYFGTWY